MWAAAADDLLLRLLLTMILPCCCNIAATLYRLRHAFVTIRLLRLHLPSLRSEHHVVTVLSAPGAAAIM